MPSRRYLVKATVEEAVDMIKLSQSSSTPVFEEIRAVAGQHRLATLVYENYFLKNNCHTALFVTIHDFYEQVEVTVISTGDSNNILFYINWRNAYRYFYSIKKALSPVLMNETKL